MLSEGSTMKGLLTFSRVLHKYVGLLILFFLMLIGTTGILLNHPSLIDGMEVPHHVLGKSYEYDNWNRFSFRDSLVLDDGTIVIGGKLGVFAGRPGGESFAALNGGLPAAVFLRDTTSLAVVNRPDGARLFAGTRGGLFFRDAADDRWSRVSAPAAHESIVDLAAAGDTVYAFTKHRVFAASPTPGDPVFVRTTLALDSAGRHVPGFNLLFIMHHGELFGLPGRLVADGTAVALIFLSLTGGYTWLFPGRLRKRLRRSGTKLFAFSYRYHLKLGIWFAAPLLVIALTGALIRPPLIVLLKSWEVPDAWLGGSAQEILKAAVTGDGTLIVAAKSGWYRGRIDQDQPLQPCEPPFPVFSMGPTVLEPVSAGMLLAGSFSGLYYWNTANNTGVDLAGGQAQLNDGLRPADLMAAGALVKDGNLLAYADYSKGLQSVSVGRILLDTAWPESPQLMRMSLYHFLFELHNGRFFRDLIGGWYILYVPLLGLLAAFVVITGVIDWCGRKLKRPRAQP